MRRAAAAILIGLLVALASAGFAEDTAKQAEAAATRELEEALAAHAQLSREAALLEQRLRDLREQKRVAKQALAKLPGDP